MAQAVDAVVTDRWREKMARINAGDVSLGVFQQPYQFKIGEGGWQTVLLTKEPLVPDPTLTAMTAGTGIYTSPDDFIFSKLLLPGDLVFVSPTRLQITCTVASSEANDDGHGNPPEFFELGVFDLTGNMLIYSTFPVEIKTSSRTLQHIIYVDF